MGGAQSRAAGVGVREGEGMCLEMWGGVGAGHTEMFWVGVCSPEC